MARPRLATQPLAGQDEAELQIVEMGLTQPEIDDALKRLHFPAEAQKRLKYMTRPGESERSIRRFKAKLRNVDSKVKPLPAFNLTQARFHLRDLSADGKQRDQDHQASQAEVAERDVQTISEKCDEQAVKEYAGQRRKFNFGGGVV
ncbi:hypothetical protein V1524DRAFT_413707 [Lipomyces starkeyi]